MELDIIQFLTNKINFDRYAKHIKDYTLTKECSTIIKDFDYYYTSTKKTNIDIGDFITWFNVVRHPSWSEEVQSVYEVILTRVRESLDSGHGVDDTVVEHFVKLDIATRLFDASAKIAEGLESDMSVITDLLEEYEANVGSINDTTSEIRVLNDDDLLSILEDETSMGEYEWRLSELNQSIGKSGTGDLIGLVGRPDAGKTTMLAAEATYRASLIGADEQVLWFNNEEGASKVKLKLIMSALAKTKIDIMKDPAGSTELYYEAVGGKGKIIILDGTNMTERSIIQKCKEYNPKMIIIDQLAKVVLNHNENRNNEAQQSLALSRFARGLAKEYCQVIFTAWAGGEVEGVKYIDMSHIYGSKTGVQGEADALITIGRSNDEPTLAARNNRYLYIPKNKICNGDPAFYNGKFEVTVQGDIARFK